MPKDTTSPFTPGRPVSLDLFVGRDEELEHLRRRLHSAAGGGLEVGFIVGERGIGKTSLANYAEAVAEEREGLLAVHAFLGGVTTLTGMVRKVYDGLAKRGKGSPWKDAVWRFLGDHIQQVGALGINVQFQATDEQLVPVVESFADSLRSLVSELGTERNGLLVVLDDINGLASSGEFANWLKSFIDEVATSREPLPLCLLLVGLAERRGSLVELQPSLARVFDLFEMEPWTDRETEAFYAEAFGSVSMTVEPSALQTLARHTGGLPFLAHEIGDAAFERDDDGRIDDAEAGRAVVRAAGIVGNKYLRPQVMEALRSPRYRSILRKVAIGARDSRFRRSDVLPKLTQEERTGFDSFIRRMRDLGVLTADPDEGRGSYRFASGLYLLFLVVEALIAGTYASSGERSDSD